MKIYPLIVSLMVSGFAHATEWHVLGARPTAMGGAGIALADGPLGAYWNPASVGRGESLWGLELPAGGRIEISGSVLKGANDINEIANACPNGAACTQANIDAALSSMNQPGNGVRADVGFGGNLKIKKIAVFANQFVYVGAMPSVDRAPANTTPAAIAAGSNNSKLVVRGLSVTEIGVAYGHALPWVPSLTVGGSLKGLIGRAGYADFLVLRDDAGGSDALTKFKDGAKQSFQPGIDLGVLWDVSRLFPIVPFRPKVGLTARNINGPRFDQPEQAKVAGQANHLSLHGNARLGVSISPFSFWHIAADADLTRNLTMVDGQASRVLSLGTEINLFNGRRFNLPLRAGISRNVAENGSNASVSVGLGLNLMHVRFDLAASATPETQAIQSQGSSQKVPSAAAFSAQLGILF